MTAYVWVSTYVNCIPTMFALKPKIRQGFKSLSGYYADVAFIWGTKDVLLTKHLMSILCICLSSSIFVKLSLKWFPDKLPVWLFYLSSLVTSPMEGSSTDTTINSGKLDLFLPDSSLSESLDFYVMCNGTSNAW